MAEGAVQLETGAFRFRDLLNKQCRFIPLWLGYVSPPVIVG